MKAGLEIWRWVYEERIGCYTWSVMGAINLGVVSGLVQVECRILDSNWSMEGGFA